MNGVAGTPDAPNGAMAQDAGSVDASLAELGRDAAWRRAMVDVLRRNEREWAATGRDIRGEITGPVCDALHHHAGTLRKVLTNGLAYDFLYRSRIARAVVLSPREHPDHIWEPQTTRLLRYLALESQHVLIGGAHDGDQALLVAQALQQHGGICHAIEPNAEAVGLLEQNATTNHFDNLHVYRRVLSHATGHPFQLTGGGSDGAAVAVDDSQTKPDQTIESIAIDDFVEAHGLDSLGLIMLDIEGGEHDALRGAEGQLKRSADDSPNIIFEVHRDYVDWSNGLDQTPIVQMLAEYGYTCLAVRDVHSNMPMDGRPIELIPPKRVYLDGPPHGFNMVAVKDPSVLDGPMFRYCCDVSPKLIWHKDPALHHPLDGRPWSYG